MHKGQGTGQRFLAGFFFILEVQFIDFRCTAQWFSYTNIFFFCIFSVMAFHRILTMCPVLYRTLLFIHSIYNSLYLLIPNSQSRLPPPLVGLFFFFNINPPESGELWTGQTKIQRKSLLIIWIFTKSRSVVLHWYDCASQGTFDSVWRHCWVSHGCDGVLGCSWQIVERG